LLRKQRKTLGGYFILPHLVVVFLILSIELNQCFSQVVFVMSLITFCKRLMNEFKNRSFSS